MLWQRSVTHVTSVRSDERMDGISEASNLAPAVPLNDYSTDNFAARLCPGSKLTAT